MALPNRKKQGSKRPLFNMYWMYALIAISLLALYYFQDGSQSKEVDWSDFEHAALAGDFDKIAVQAGSGTAEGILTTQGAKNQKFDMSSTFAGDKKLVTTIPSSDKIQEKIDTWNTALQAEGKPAIKVTYEKGSDLMKFIWYFGPVFLIFFFMYYMSKRMSGGAGGGGIFNVGKSKAMVFDKDNGTNVTFDDVAGLSEAKVEIEEIVEFLKNPQRYTDLGAKIPKGA